MCVWVESKKEIIKQREIIIIVIIIVFVLFIVVKAAGLKQQTQLIKIFIIGIGTICTQPNQTKPTYNCLLPQAKPHPSFSLSLSLSIKWRKLGLGLRA